ncbi:MAG: EamA family transporter [Thaumarchaeota archaeon]|nr:EamA family transporter [Nitrososphaerota archaeon]
MKLERRAMGFLLVASASVIWGSNGVLVDLIPLPSDAIAFFRVFLATLLLLPFVPRGFRRNWKEFVALGLLLSSGWVSLFQAMKLIPIGVASLLNYMAPIFVAVMASPLLGERIGMGGWVSLGVAGVGMLLISSESFGGALDPFGVGFALLSGILYAVFIVYSKKLLNRLPFMSVAFYSYMVASVILSPSVLRVELDLSLGSWMLLLLLGSLNTALAVTIYFKGLELIKAHEAAILSYLEPVSALVFGYALLAQRPSPVTLMGGALIILAGCLLAKLRD